MIDDCRFNEIEEIRGTAPRATGKQVEVMAAFDDAWAEVRKTRLEVEQGQVAGQDLRNIHTLAGGRDSGPDAYAAVETLKAERDLLGRDYDRMTKDLWASNKRVKETEEKNAREKAFWYEGVADDLHQKGLLTDEGKKMMYSWASLVRREV